jgi:uncharacterized membrane protein YkvA (DUF1232 family)
MDTLASIILAVALAWLLLIAALWVIRPRDVGLADIVRLVPDVLRLVRNLLVDSATPTSVRVALGLLLVWLLSPIDLIPEFIPVLGPVDDAIVTVLVLGFARQRLGDDALRAKWTGTPGAWELLARLIGARSTTR